MAIADAKKQQATIQRGYSLMRNHSEHEVVELKSARWRLRLQPHIGLQTQSCQILHNHAWHNLMPDCAAPDALPGTPLSASNFHMLPYSNRIRDGRFSHNNQNIELENAENHAIHGALRKLAWRTTEQSTSSVTAEYDTRKDGDVNWPWPIHSSVTYTLDETQLISEMSLTNHGTSSMPAGMGWHPYFCRAILRDEPELTLAVDGVYPDTNGDCLPTGAAIALSDALNFNTARELDAEQRIDHCLQGFRSPATLHWPTAGIKLQLHASENCTHLVLFNPEQPYFAVEPVTNANDAFNLATKGIDSGVSELAPGQTLNAQMRLVLT